MLSVSQNIPFIFCVHYHSFIVIFMLLYLKFYIRIKIDLHTITVFPNSVFSYIFTCTRELYFQVLSSFHYSSKDFSISHKAGLVVMKSLSFCLYGKVFISPIIFEG